MLPKGDWNEGENPFRDVSKGLAVFVGEDLVGRKALIVSPDVLYNCREYNREQE